MAVVNSHLNEVHLSLQENLSLLITLKGFSVVINDQPNQTGIFDGTISIRESLTENYNEKLYEKFNEKFYKKLFFKLCLTI